MKKISFMICFSLLLVMMTGCGSGESSELTVQSPEYQLVLNQVALLQGKGVDSFWNTAVDPACQRNIQMKHQLTWLLQTGVLRLISLEKCGENSLRAIVAAGPDENGVMQSFLLNRVDGKILWATGI